MTDSTDPTEMYSKCPICKKKTTSASANESENLVIFHPCECHTTIDSLQNEDDLEILCTQLNQRCTDLSFLLGLATGILFRFEDQFVDHERKTYTKIKKRINELFYGAKSK
jgi:hypothetical protein